MHWHYFRWAVSRLDGKPGVHVRSLYASSPVPHYLFFLSLSVSFFRYGWRTNSSGNVWEKRNVSCEHIYHNPNLRCWNLWLGPVEDPSHVRIIYASLATRAGKPCQEWSRGARLSTRSTGDSNISPRSSRTRPDAVAVLGLPNVNPRSGSTQRRNCRICTVLRWLWCLCQVHRMLRPVKFDMTYHKCANFKKINWARPTVRILPD